MKTTLGRKMKAAAVMLIAAGAASAQTMTGEVPFAFRAGKKLLPAGVYRVEVRNANQLVILSNSDAKHNVILFSSDAGVVANEWRAKGDPVLAFECSTGRCALIRLWAGFDSPTLSVPHQSSVRFQEAKLTLVPMVRAAE